MIESSSAEMAEVHSVSELRYRRRVDEALLAHADAFGIDLQAIGLAARAFQRTHALDYVSIAEARGQCVLGGDVLVRESSRENWRHARENWSCDRSDGERFSSYVRRSAQVARDYISKFADDDAAYVTVVWPG